MKSTPQLGTIIHGTLRPQDLIPAFLECLRFDCNDPKLADFINTMIPSDAISTLLSGDDTHPWWDSEECSAVLNEDLCRALHGHAPPWCYFGTHEGDGSDWGFWPNWDVIEREVFETLIIKVSDMSELDAWGFPNGCRAPILLVNDNGTVAFGYLSDQGKGGFVPSWECVSGL